MAAKTPDDDDRVLLLKLKGGDYFAFEILYHRYKVVLTASILKLVKSPELAEDLLQDAFVKLWEYRSRLDEHQEIGAYLYRIAVNLVYDTFRKASKDKKVFEEVFSAMLYAQLRVEDPILVQEEKDLLLAAIVQLPPKRREVFILCKIESKSYEEVSAQLNISLSTINDHIYKANLFLKQKLRHSLFCLFIILSIL